MLAGLFDGAKRRLAASDIQSQRQQRVAVLRLEILERAWVTRGGGDPVAALQRCLRPLATEAARTTGYEPCLVSHRTILVTSLRGPTATVGDSQKAAARARRRACGIPPDRPQSRIGAASLEIDEERDTTRVGGSALSGVATSMSLFP